MQVAFYLAGEITQVIDSIPLVRCASGNVSSSLDLNLVLGCGLGGKWGVSHKYMMYGKQITENHSLGKC